MVEKSQATKIVKWFMADKGLIKFNGDEAQYFLADNVKKVSDFVKYPLFKGDSVSVTIVEDKVTYLRKVKSDAPKTEAPEKEPEQPKEEKPEAVKDTREILTIQAVATDKKVVKFTERPEDKWFKIAEDIQKLDYKEIGLVANAKVTVVLEGKTVVKVNKTTQESTPEASSKAIETKPEPSPVASETVPEKPKTEYKRYNNESDARQISIECQAMINAASQVTGMVASNITPPPSSEALNKMVRIIAKENYKLLQELKNGNLN